MKNLVYISIFFVSVFIYSCNGAENSVVNESGNDSLAIDTSMIDTLTIEPIDTAVIDSSGYANEEEVLATVIEEKFGEQWDFCDCVVKNDSVNKAIETAGDDEFDALLERMDVIDQHCKEMLTTPNTTPEERSKHERKVNKCLRSAK